MARGYGAARAEVKAGAEASAGVAAGTRLDHQMYCAKVCDQRRAQLEAQPDVQEALAEQRAIMAQRARFRSSRVQTARGRASASTSASVSASAGWEQLKLDEPLDPQMGNGQPVIGMIKSYMDNVVPAGVMLQAGWPGALL